MTILTAFWDAIKDIFAGSGIHSIFAGDWRNLVMVAVACGLLYLGIGKKFEPLLMIPIAFGMLLANLPGAGMSVQYHDLQGFVELVKSGSTNMIDWLYLGVKAGIFPPLIFIGIGAMTDFSPLIARPSSFILGAAAQFGIFGAFLLATILGFNANEAGSIGIIGGADGPTAILTTSILAPELLGPIAVAAYSYMALIPVIQPPIMKLLTTKKERSVVMTSLRPVSQTEKVLFPILVTIVVALILPSAAVLVGCLMFGNLLKESKVAERLTKAVQNELMNIVTVCLGLSVGATTNGKTFLTFSTIKIVVLGLVAFALATTAGVLFGKLMYVITKGKVNPLIGSAGVSAVPMAARVSQKVGQEENPQNFLLMHAMGPNVAGVIGSAVAAGVLIAMIPH
jgi:oxaloacetate decarboxylase beta subunit